MFEDDVIDIINSNCKAADSIRAESDMKAMEREQQHHATMKKRKYFKLCSKLLMMLCGASFALGGVLATADTFMYSIVLIFCGFIFMIGSYALDIKRF